MNTSPHEIPSSDSRIRVLVLFDSSYPYAGGGRETGIYHISKYSQSSLDLRMIAYRPGPKDTKVVFSNAENYCRILRVTAFRSLWYARGYNTIAHVADILMFPTLALLKASRGLDSWKPDVIMTFHASPLAVTAIRLARELKCKSAVNIRAYYSDEISRTAQLYRPFLGYTRRMERRAIRDVDLVLANGVDTFDYAKALRTQDKATVLVHNGVDTTLFSPKPEPDLREKLRLQDAVVFISNNPLRPIKGIADAIKAFAMIPTALRSRCRLVFLGRGHVTRFRQLAEDLGVDDLVHFLGFIPHENVPDYLNIGHVALYPHLFGAGTSHAALESLSCGLPQIAYNCAGFRATCIDGVTGILVPVRNISALSRAMTTLGENEILRQTMSREARRYALEFDWQKYVERYVSGLRQVVGKP